MNSAQYVKSARMRLRMSRSKFAEAIGVSTERIKEWETGAEQVPLTVVETIGGMLKRPLVELSPVAGNIKRYRLQAGMQQWRLGAAVGVAPQHVYEWERGMVPRRDRLRKIARALGVSIKDLLSESSA